MIFETALHPFPKTTPTGHIYREPETTEDVSQWLNDWAQGSVECWDDAEMTVTPPPWLSPVMRDLYAVRAERDAAQERERVAAAAREAAEAALREQRAANAWMSDRMGVMDSRAVVAEADNAVLLACVKDTSTYWTHGATAIPSPAQLRIRELAAQPHPGAPLLARLRAAEGVATMLAEVAIYVACQCDEAYTKRGLHESNSLCHLEQDVRSALAEWKEAQP